jgi:diguanylate cyclase (GGDEF)-like protein
MAAEPAAARPAQPAPPESELSGKPAVPANEGRLAGDTRPRRALLALALGVASLALEQVALPVLTAEVPLRLGVAPLLAAFVLLGPRLGLVAALPLLAGGAAAGSEALAVAAVHVIEAACAAWVYPRLQSLAAAVAVFWCTAGLWVDAVVFGWLFDHSMAAVALRYAGHVFGGLVSAFIAGAALHLAARPWTRPTPAGSVRRYFSVSAMWLVVGPVLALTLLLAATTYREERARANDEARRATEATAAAVAELMAARGQALDRMADEVARAASGRPVARTDLDRQREANPGFAAVRLREDGEVSPDRYRVVDEPLQDVPLLVLGAALPASGARPAPWLEGTLDRAVLRAALERHRPPEAEVALWAAGVRLARADPRPPLGPAQRHATLATVPSLGWTVKMEQPLEAVQRGARGALLRLLLAFLAAVAVVQIAAGVLAHTVAAPLTRLDQAAQAMEAGRPVDAALTDGLGRSPIAEIRSLAAHLAGTHESLAFHDAMTGLPNQKLLLDRLSMASAQAVDARTSFALLLVDLDRFRVIDSTLGRTLSNELLRKIARRLQECVRAGDTVARVGGDEFALLVPRGGRMEDATELAIKVMDVVRRPFVVAGQEVFVTASVGISLYPRDGLDAETLLKNAMAAAYAAKEQGQDSYRRYTARIKVRDAQRLLIETGLRRALENDGLELHYQPMVDIRTGSVLAVEALVRWRREDVGLVDAGTFIPVAEASGLITAIDLWVVRAACAQAAAWRSRGHQLVVAVNLSAREIHEPDVVDHIRHALDTAGVPPSLLEIEITESVALRDVDRCVEVLGDLRRLGVSISVDDFGTGYSSLSYLRRLPVDRVKLDRSFVQDITTNADDAAIATAVIAMTHSLRLKVVAEGVETLEQLAFLRSHGCDAIQGRLFSWPVPAEEIEPLLREGRRLVQT